MHPFARRLWYNFQRLVGNFMDKELFIAADGGGTKTEFALFSRDGVVAARQEQAVRHRYQRGS